MTLDRSAQREAAAPDDAALLSASTEDLVREAGLRRDRCFGRRITYSPKVFIPLTMLCRDHCGYCTFAKPPARLGAPYLDLDEVVAIAAAGAAAGCHEALFTLGELPELRYPTARRFLDANGFERTVDYLAAACAAVLEGPGLLPHANAGALPPPALARLREVTVSQGMMLETLRRDLDCHRRSPDKTPERRMATLEAAGVLRIPFTTGILVGIGESEADRLEALRAIASVANRFGHVQEVIVQNFLPKPGTAMRDWPAATEEAHVRAVALARLVLPDEVHVQAPPNLASDLAALLDAGIDDWGGVSPVTADHVNPERPWPELALLEAATAAAGFTLAPRLAIHPGHLRERDRWLAPGPATAALQHADAEWLARDHAWVSGGTVPPPLLLRPPAGSQAAPPPAASSAPAPRGRGPATAVRGGRVAEVLDGVRAGQDPGVDELVALFAARGREVEEVASLADELRREAVGETVTWVANRNINYTNICTFKCRFCAFSKGPRSLDLRGEPYLLSLDEISERVAQAEAAGATEVCLQGGIHPKFDGEYYLDVLHAVRAASKTIHIHGFTALEVTEGARRLSEPLETYLRRLYDAGLRSLPGTAAEILDDPVRSILCPDKIDTETWLEVHRLAHSVGLRSNVTIMFGAIEEPVSWARHLLRTAALQDQTGGFTEFVPLPFVHMAAPLYRQGRARKGPTFRESVLMHAVGRIAYRGRIPNVQASWVKLGESGVRQLLRAGCNDLGGTLMDENISRAAGAAHGQRMDEAAFRRIVEPLGRPLAQRTTLYAPASRAA